MSENKGYSTLRERFLATMKTIRALTGVTQDDFDVLRGIATETSAWKDEFVTSFYDILFGQPQTAAVFTANERTQREKTLGNWYLDLFKIDDEELFWDIQVRIAFYHVQRRVYNQYMVAIGNRFEELFLRKVIAALGPEKGVEASASFNRIMDTVVGITIALYDSIVREGYGISLEQSDEMVSKHIGEVQKDYLSGFSKS
ncbi:protoglobin domain-containing protein [Candidatus Uabimicrobium amorphum]|uniref:Globin-sensor domain-containing protein n=1 Tax=Uabimicrobium amorphum TaxID=2596890 RepID=A0A5S9IML9_UABAM|nr:protoglobin domain-containing protein [Candidatus Uabimicrobium amorphum]BBM84226.1 hypothetical protein UABAM_02582 [Candidatus Uabimicrobium amorphum]